LNSHTNKIIEIGAVKIKAGRIIDRYSQLFNPGKPIPYKITSRRAGDMDVSIADISKAEELLGWKPRYDIMKMCQDTWKWQQKHPNGYDD